jgi:hypothetical protein
MSMNEGGGSKVQQGRRRTEGRTSVKEGEGRRE